jgi:7,8-dihydropterin-6-yl-methyl-4-(beta-D-ribofuranosyl)aminobenzene 5'-phosphate synthase
MVVTMKISAIIENTTIDTALTPKHGLSIYIETTKHKILFDLGPDDTCLHNAKTMGIDLAEVDIVVLSHGHYDHGGALASFLKINDKAKLYFHRKAFLPYYQNKTFSKKYIGLDQSLADNERIIFTDDTLRIDDELFILSNIEGQFDTQSNRVLLKKTGNGYEQDDFIHEQSLIVTAENRTALFSGCSHRGINNIMHAALKHQPVIQAVFGGFHLYNPISNVIEPPEVIKRLASELSGRETVFYTCHCTGIIAFEMMSGIMGDKIQYLSTGSVIIL